MDRFSDNEQAINNLERS